MSLSKLGAEVNNIQKLADSPTLTPQELKKVFDQAGIDIKEYINEILTKELDEILAKKANVEQGKGFSSNDFSNVLLKKLQGIEEGANKYTHPTNAGNKHIPAGGSAGQILKYKANGEVVWSKETVINKGTANPSGGADGDFYIQYF